MRPQMSSSFVSFMSSGVEQVHVQDCVAGKRDARKVNQTLYPCANNLSMVIIDTLEDVWSDTYESTEAAMDAGEVERGRESVHICQCAIAAGFRMSLSEEEPVPAAELTVVPDPEPEDATVAEVAPPTTRKKAIHLTTEQESSLDVLDLARRTLLRDGIWTGDSKRNPHGTVTLAIMQALRHLTTYGKAEKVWLLSLETEKSLSSCFEYVHNGGEWI